MSGRVGRYLRRQLIHFAAGVGGLEEESVVLSPNDPSAGFAEERPRGRGCSVQSPMDHSRRPFTVTALFAAVFLGACTGTPSQPVASSEPSTATSSSGSMVGSPSSTSPTFGTLSGHFKLAGGPAPGTVRPLSGTVTVTGPGGTRTVAVAADGAYTFSLAPGQYRVVGTSPPYNGPGCGTDPVTVVGGSTVVADVFCSMR